MNAVFKTNIYTAFIQVSWLKLMVPIFSTVLVMSAVENETIDEKLTIVSIMPIMR